VSRAGRQSASRGLVRVVRDWNKETQRVMSLFAAPAPVCRICLIGRSVRVTALTPVRR
jgi:hypothetical protein